MHEAEPAALLYAIITGTWHLQNDLGTARDVEDSIRQQWDNPDARRAMETRYEALKHRRIVPPLAENQ